MVPLAILLDLVAIALAAGLACLVLLHRRPTARLPPGPPGWPILGHLPLMASVGHPWRKWHEWGKRYSNGLLCLNMAGQTVLVVTSARVAKDLMEKHANALADRPQLIVASKIISDSRRMVISSYTPKVRRARQFLHQNLAKGHSFAHIQERESKVLALNLLDQPHDFADHCQLFSSNLVLEVVYGLRCKSVKDPYIVRLVQDVEEWTRSAEPGYHLVDAFPVLNKLPRFCRPWQRHGERLHANELSLYNSLLEPTRQELKAGHDPDCLARYLIEQQSQNAFDDKDVAYVLGTLFEAGSDTSTSTLLALIMALCINPAALASAQAELDRVVGDHRLPSLEDKADCPYIECLWKEVQRWRPSAPFAVPHYLSGGNLDYDGYTLPQHAQVIGCTYAIGRDTTVYGEDVESFRPERFSSPSVQQQADLMGPMGSPLFGYGRRVCPGMHVATNTMFLTFATICWAFNVEADPDHPIDVNDYSPTFVSRANPFKCKIAPRSAHKAEMIRTAGSEALQELAL